VKKRGHAVLLGATGFVGRNLRARLEDDGWSVEGLSYPGFDLAEPRAGKALAARLKPGTLLVHAARSPENPHSAACFEAETCMALETAAALRGGPAVRFVFFSSLSVYGDARTDLEISERTPVSPTSLYGIAKLGAEALLRAVCLENGIPCTVLRPCKVYGPGDPSLAYGPAAFIDSLTGSGVIRLYGDGKELRDHVYVGDLCEAAVRLAEAGAPGVFNIASGGSRSYLDIVTALEDILGKKARIDEGPRTRPRIDQRVVVAKLRETLPELILTPMEVGLRRTCEAARARTA